MPEGDEGQQGQDEGQGQDMIPADALPEDLRGKDPEEVRNTLSLLGQSLKSRNEENKELRDELRELRQQLRAGGHEGPEEPEEPEEELSEEELKELAIDDPVKAVDHALSKLGYKEQFQGVGQTASQALGEAAFMRASREIEGFDEHEDDVREILEETGAPPNLNNIENAYNLVLGRKYRQERVKKRKQEAASEEPSPPSGKEEEESKPSLEPGSLHAEIAEALDVSEEDLEEYGGEGPLQMDVPTGEVPSGQ